MYGHILYCRYHNIIYLYINGKKYSAVSNNNLSVSNTNKLYLGYGEKEGAITSVQNRLSSNTSIDLLGSNSTIVKTEVRNGSTIKYLSLYNYIRFDFTKLRTIFLVFRTPVTTPEVDLLSWSGSRQRIVPLFTITATPDGLNSQGNPNIGHYFQDGILVDFATNYQKPADGSKSDLEANTPLGLGELDNKLSSKFYNDSTISGDSGTYTIHFDNYPVDLFGSNKYINGSEGFTQPYAQSALNNLTIIGLTIPENAFSSGSFPRYELEHMYINA